MTRGVYLIWCTDRERGYVGSSKDVYKRWREHRALLRSGQHDNQALQRAWDKYGGDAFEFSILERVSGDLLGRETFWIGELNTYRAGYNQTPTALPLTHPTPEWREGRRQAMITMNKTRIQSPEQRAASRKRLIELNKLPQSRSRREQSRARARRMHAEGRANTSGLLPGGKT